MTDRELMQQVMENICGAKLCEINSMSSRQEMLRLLDKAINALRERLAQQELMIDCPRCGHCCPQPNQEPVAWANKDDLQNCDMRVRTGGGPYHTVPLYTTPPAAQPFWDLFD